MSSLKRNVCRYRVLMILVCSILPGQLTAGMIFQSASVPASQFPAIAVPNNAFAQQAPGVLFQITQTTLVDSIGVWAWHNNSTPWGGLFGEIFSLANLTSFPSTDPYSSSGLGRAYFPTNDSGVPADLVTPLSLTLTPGDYALVVGSLPSTEWEVPLNGTDSAGVSSANYIVYLAGSSFPSPPYPRWQQGQDGMRFFINGSVSAVPEPPSALLLLAFLPLIGILRSRSQRITERSQAL